MNMLLHKRIRLFNFCQDKREKLRQTYYRLGVLSAANTFLCWPKGNFMWWLPDQFKNRVRGVILCDCRQYFLLFKWPPLNTFMWPPPENCVAIAKYMYYSFLEKLLPHIVHKNQRIFEFFLLDTVLHS